MSLPICFISLLGLLLSAPSLGGERKSQKVIDFEDEVVEGLNKRPLDSFNQISDSDRNGEKPHLYRKRQSFRSETENTLRTLRLTP